MSDPINYKHLKYFHTVAHEGSIAKASEVLHVTPQTISGQLSKLEDRIGSSLFEREGRGLRLSEMGNLVLRYADDIFDLGRELNDVIRGAPLIGPSEFIVSAASALAKTIVYKILEPALHINHEIKLTCHEGPVDSILAELAVHKIDMVLSDTPLAPNLSVKGYNHFLGQCSLTFFAASNTARKYRKNFPASLTNAPILLPTAQYSIRQQFDHWLDEEGIFPIIKGEFDDSALMKSFGQAGVGIFFMPSIISDEVCRNFNVRPIGEIDALQQKFYAISTERKVKHPAVTAIYEQAKNSLFQ